MSRLVLILAIFHGAKGNMTVTPRNTVVHAGDRVELECRVEINSSIYRWDLARPSTPFNTETIARVDTNTGYLEVNKNMSHLWINVDDTGSGIIYYNSTDFENAGIYTCSAFIGLNKEKRSASAQLIVLESLPSCISNYSSEKDSSVDSVAITMRCSLNFRGFWAPTMHWTRHDGNGNATRDVQDMEDGIRNKTIPNSHVTSSLTVSRDSLGEGTFFSCRVYFERTFGGSLILNATNIPDFVYVWNSSVYGKDPNSSKAMDQTDRNQTYSWWMVPIGVALLILVIAVTVAVMSVCLIRSRRNKVQQARLLERQQTELGSCSGSPAYANDENPQNATYAEINESMISPVVFPPKTRPRLPAIADYSTTGVSQTDENNSTRLYSIFDESKLEQEVGTSPSDKSYEEPVHESLVTALATVSDDLKITDNGPFYHTLELSKTASTAEIQRPSTEN